MAAALLRLGLVVVPAGYGRPVALLPPPAVEDVALSPPPASGGYGNAGDGGSEVQYAPPPSVPVAANITANSTDAVAAAMPPPLANETAGNATETESGGVAAPPTGGAAGLPPPQASAPEAVPSGGYGFPEGEGDDVEVGAGESGGYGFPPPSAAQASPPPPVASQPPQAVASQPPPLLTAPPPLAHPTFAAMVWVNTTWPDADAAQLPVPQYALRLRTAVRASLADLAGVPVADVELLAVTSASASASAAQGVYVSARIGVESVAEGYLIAGDVLDAKTQPGGVFAASTFLEALGTAEVDTALARTRGEVPPPAAQTSPPPPQVRASPPPPTPRRATPPDSAPSPPPPSPDDAPAGDEDGGLLDGLPLVPIAAGAGLVLALSVGGMAFMRCRSRRTTRRGGGFSSGGGGRMWEDSGAFSSLDIDDDAVGGGVELVGRGGGGGGIGSGGRGGPPGW